MFLQYYLQPVSSSWCDTSRHCYCKALCIPSSCERWGVMQIFFVVICHLRSHYQDPADENKLSKHDVSFHHDVWGTTVPVLFISSLLCYHLQSHYQDPADENKVGKHDVSFHCDVWGTTVPVLFISSLLCYHLQSHYQDPADENKVGKHDVSFHCDVWGTTVDDDDCFSIALFSALQQTHCARTWFYTSE